MAEVISARRKTGGGGPTSYGGPLVAIDTTPLLGIRTGIGHLVAGLVGALDAAGEVRLRPYEVTWRGRSGSAQPLPMPARPLHAVWRRSELAPIEWFRGRVDVVHGTNYVVPPARHARRLVSVHDLTALHHPQFVEPASIGSLAIAARAIRCGAVVHADSVFVADEIRNWQPRADVRVISPGVPPLGPSGPVPQHLRGRRFVLALGTVEPRKDLPGLLRAFRGVPDDVLLVFAGSPGWGNDALAREMELAPVQLRERVLRLGYVDDPTRVALLMAAGVFAYPSRYEGFGLPVLEAMSLGTPVVTTTAGALPEVSGGAAVLVPPNDPDALGAALAAALEGRHPHAELGRSRAAAFRWDACAAAFGSLYAALADGCAR